MLALLKKRFPLPNLRGKSRGAVAGGRFDLKSDGDNLNKREEQSLPSPFLLAENIHWLMPLDVI